MNQVVRNVARAGMLSLSIKERSALYTAYLPFVKGGGLFIPTAREYQMNDQVFMLLTLMDDPTKYPVSGRVIWITPAGAQGNRQKGIGIQFEENDACMLVRAKIDGILGNAIKSTKSTHTM